MSTRAAALLLLLLPGLARAQESESDEASEPAPPPEPVAPPSPTEILRRLEIVEQGAAARTMEAPVVSADEKGFGISSADKAHEVKIRGLVQIDARRHMDTQDPALADKDTFLPRRIRPTLD